jgi:hypothetical protein
VKKPKKNQTKINTQNNIKNNYVQIWTKRKGSTLLLGFSRANVSEPEFSVCVSRNAANNLIIELCAFIMNIDAAELREYTDGLLVSIKNELDYLENEQQSKLH